MRRKGERAAARLFLNDQDVGSVHVKGWDDAWGFGDFVPGEAFARYAQHFGRWSRLIHAPHADHRLSDADRAALREVEYEIDRLHAKLFLADRRQWRPIAQLNIDGPMVEWREDYGGGGMPSAA
jgi:hypothetical protein